MLISESSTKEIVSSFTSFIVGSNPMDPFTCVFQNYFFYCVEITLVRLALWKSIDKQYECVTTCESEASVLCSTHDTCRDETRYIEKYF